MSYYETCPRCGANLDPGERCDCQTEVKAMFLSIKDLAARWACSTDLVRDLIRKGALPAMKIGNVLRIAISHVEAYESSMTSHGEMPKPRTARTPVLRL